MFPLIAVHHLAPHNKSGLLHPGSVVPVLAGDGDQGEAHLQGPGVHHRLDVHLRGEGPVLVALLCQVPPQVVLGGRLVLQLGQVVRQTLGRGKS